MEGSLTATKHTAENKPSVSWCSSSGRHSSASKYSHCWRGVNFPLHACRKQKVHRGKHSNTDTCATSSNWSIMFCKKKKKGGQAVDLRPHLNNFMSSEASNDGIHRRQIPLGCVGKVSHSSFIQLFQLCNCVEFSHCVKQGIGIWLYGKIPNERIKTKLSCALIFTQHQSRIHSF